MSFFLHWTENVSLPSVMHMRDESPQPISSQSQRFVETQSDQSAPEPHVVLHYNFNKQPVFPHMFNPISAFTFLVHFIFVYFGV